MGGGGIIRPTGRRPELDSLPVRSFIIMEAKIMKMAKKFLAVALAGVLALSVLTGCGNSANTKSIAEAMSDMSKAAGITFKEDTKLNTKAKAIAEALANTAATVDNNTDDATEKNLTPDQKTKIMTTMGDSYKEQFVWISITETKGYNATAQAANLLGNMVNVNTPEGKGEAKEPVDTYYIGTTTVTKDGTTIRFAVITAAAKAEQTPGGGESTDQGSKE